MLAAAAVAAAGCGGGGGGDKTGPNAKKFTGDKRDVAQVVDDLVDDAHAGDAKAICTQIFTSALAAAIGQRNKTTCETAVKKQLVTPDERIAVTAISVKAPQAQAIVQEQNGNKTRLQFLKLNGRWQINALQ
jgi:hypothetical protein